jgi:hypothetical protein
MLQRQIQEYRILYAIPSGEVLTWQVFPAMLSGSASVFFTRMFALNSVSLLAVVAGCVALWRNGHKLVVLAVVWCISLSALIAFVISANGIDVASRYLLHVSVLALMLIGGTCMWQRSARWWVSPAMLGAIILSIYLYSGIEFALRSAQLHPNWRAVASLIREVGQPNEPVVVLGWDATPIQFYLTDQRLLTSFDFETQLQQPAHHSSYLLVQSETGRALSLPKPSTELWQNTVDHVSVLRYVP